MPITKLQEFQGENAFASSIGIATPAVTIPVGNVLLLSYAGSVNVNPITSVTDTAGNTWNYAGEIVDVSGNFALVVYHCRVTNAITTGQTVTVNYSFGAGGSVHITEFSGIAAANYLGGVVSNRQAFDPFWTSGTIPKFADKD